MRSIMAVAAIAAALGIGGCSKNSLEKFNTFQTNFQAVVVGINADIAATAPVVAHDCAELQKWAMMIAPFVPNSGKAQQYFGAANGALTGFCQTTPTDVAGTANSLLAAVNAAKVGYDAVSK